ncbi:phage baseplate assembly protein V, partial [Capnocytophaga canis]|uniref:phage baseplate assembly protein V n=1 Tax=Capnocytophaga canis TaxID=1848903 RepID=UPI001F5119EC
TEWIRVMTPDAGGSDKVSKNRGFVAIPEIGDQVMVGFIHNHPDRPYVMGSLFHGKVGSGGGSGNNVKSLSSKSGHTIELNDAGGITIRDKSGGDMIVLDGTNKITVTSTQTIELNNGESAIKLDKNKITIHADEIEISKTEGDASKIEIKGLETLISGKNNVTVKSEGKMLLDSQGAMDVKSTGTLTASGSTAKLESKGITEVKGTTVNIN